MACDIFYNINALQNNLSIYSYSWIINFMMQIVSMSLHAWMHDVWSIMVDYEHVLRESFLCQLHVTVFMYNTIYTVTSFGLLNDTIIATTY